MKADGEDLVLNVPDDKSPWGIDFQERSRGFQWFFSFYLTFLVESSKAHRGAILLLDEPSLRLHITAQKRLLGFSRARTLTMELTGRGARSLRGARKRMRVGNHLIHTQWALLS
jgi:hypothetical protein